MQGAVWLQCIIIIIIFFFKTRSLRIEAVVVEIPKGVVRLEIAGSSALFNSQK